MRACFCHSAIAKGYGLSQPRRSHPAVSWRASTASAGGTSVLHALWVPNGDVLGFARTVEGILTSWDREAQRWARLSDDGARHIRSTYTRRKFAETVAAAFDGVGASDDQRVLGGLPSECWSAGGLWPRVVSRLRVTARAAMSGSS